MNISRNKHSKYLKNSITFRCQLVLATESDENNEILRIRELPTPTLSL